MLLIYEQELELLSSMFYASTSTFCHEEGLIYENMDELRFQWTSWQIIVKNYIYIYIYIYMYIYIYILSHFQEYALLELK